MDAASPPVDLVPDCGALLACLTRMHVSSRSLMFWNATRQFRIMLREDSRALERLAFEVCLVPRDDEEEELPGLRRAMVNECDWDVEDGGVVVLESFSLDLAEAERDPSALEGARALINGAYRYSVCGCGDQLIKDDGDACMFCDLTGAARDRAEHCCAICQEHGRPRDMARQACCSNMLHRTCLAVWEAKSGGARCPLCRDTKRPRAGTS